MIQLTNTFDQAFAVKSRAMEYQPGFPQPEMAPLETASVAQETHMRSI
jgi:hypothetical protein